jgi:hypothetical protein
LAVPGAVVRDAPPELPGRQRSRQVIMQVPATGRLPLFIALAAALGGCATPAADRRAAEWRAILAAEAPPGAPAADVEAALRRRGITPGRGTHVTVGDDGRTSSACPDPKSAVTGREVAGRIGFNTNVVETVSCLDPQGRVLSHQVGIWIQ